MIRYLIAAALLCLSFAVGAQVTSTRTTAYDFQCQDSAGTRISDHARFDTAFVACLNAPNGMYVQGGRYRITKFAVTPEPPAATGSATLSWTPQTTNTDGSTLSDLAGYHINYGRSPDALTEVIRVENPALSGYIVSGLAGGAWYFGVEAFDARGVESLLSNIVGKVVQ